MTQMREQETLSNGKRIRLRCALAIARTALLVTLAASVTSAAPAYAAPAAEMDIDTVIEGIQSLARFFSLAGVALLGLKMTAPGQRILQRVGLDVQDDYLVGLVIASLLLSNVETIVDFLGFGG
jgi:type IV secretory pathway VirB2 component (pilin)